jgi:hypothetical protein
MKHDFHGSRDEGCCRIQSKVFFCSIPYPYEFLYLAVGADGSQSLYHGPKEKSPVRPGPAKAANIKEDRTVYAPHLRIEWFRAAHAPEVRFHHQ